MSKTFYEAMKDRRSIYAIGNGSPIGDERIQEVIKQALTHVPSAFNCQSASVVVLFGDAHKKLWDITKETLRKIIPADNFQPTSDKIDGFAAGHGTVLYFDNTSTTKSLQEKFPGYADNFPVWANQANGMLQFAIWSSLEAEGLGVNVQHYNPLIDDEVKSTWNIPSEWQLIAEMPFGEVIAPAGDKEFLPLDQRMIVFEN